MFLMNKNPTSRSFSLINRKFIKPQLCIPRNKTTGKNNEDYQYIQRSKLPMMHFQPSLPRLPIPELSKTCTRYLNAQKPLLSSDALHKTESYVSEFLKTHGPTLQKELIHKDSKNRHTSYISGYWFDMYLRDRKPLPINYNPFLVFTPESNSEYNTQLVKATNLIISSARFMKSLRAEILEPEVYHLNSKKSDTQLFRTITGLLPSSLSWYGAYLFKAFPLDMSQYSNLFNSTRIPELEKDRIYQNTKARHVILMRKGHFYTFDVLDENGDIRPAKEIAAYVKFVLQENIPDNEYPVGIFTTSERDQWAKARSHLIEIGNKSALEKIDSAAFVVTLDDDAINDDYPRLLRKFLHDSGTNRWFDKSFSLILSKDGLAGINFEHSWGDGVAVLRFFQDVKKDISKNPHFHPHEENAVRSESFKCEKLEFTLDAKSQNWIKKEQEKYQNWIKNLDLSYLMYDGFGKNECKSFGVSPDAIMQLAFQLALYSQEGRAVPTYESCSTAAFKHGRTETIRPCTLQTKAVCETFTKSKSTITKAELKNMIIECSNAHNGLTKEAAMGQGFDRHLFALKKIWEETQSNKNFPTIFTDPAYEYLNYNILSTSTLSSPAVLAGGFGPVVQDGYGIGYMIQNEKLGAVVTSYTDHRDSSTYVESLTNAFNDIHKVFMST